MMNKFLATIFLTMSITASSPLANAQMFSEQLVSTEIYEHTIREEAEGKEVWEKLRAGEVSCTDLSKDDFEVLGEYFMGQMLGASHPSMNAMMVQMMGEEGEEQVHEVMGKRLSGCDTSAAFPAGGGSWMPMMQMMWGGWSSPFGFNAANNSASNFGILGWILMFAWWVLIIVGIIALAKWLANQFKWGVGSRSALGILKERYAKGEISKKEFDEMRREIS